jgi:hypothetical protein
MISVNPTQIATQGTISRIAVKPKEINSPALPKTIKKPAETTVPVTKALAILVPMFGLEFASIPKKYEM